VLKLYSIENAKCLNKRLNQQLETGKN